jgi:hypothetical protein
MKFLLINSVCGIRSTGRICTDIADSLASQGHQVKIAYGREDVPEKYQKYAVRIGSDLDLKLHALGTRLLDKHGFFSTKATKRFLQWAEEYDPDLLWLHNIHGYYINYPILFDYLKRFEGKVVWTLHDCWTFTGHCSYFDFVGCDKWKSGCNNCLQLHTYPKAWKIDNSKRNFELKKKYFTAIKDKLILVPVSNWLGGLLKESFLEDCELTTIHNGIDTNTFGVCDDAEQYFEKFGLSDDNEKLGF